MKTCNRCGETKDESAFHRNRANPDGLKRYCKPCNAEQVQDWRDENAEPGRKTPRILQEWNQRHDESTDRDYRREYKLRAKYGLTLDEYAAMRDAQNGVCAICDETCDRGRLAVDHDHETGEVRGLLCRACNLALGSMEDDPDRLRKAAAYLEAAV